MKAVKIAAVGLSALLCVPLLAACGEDAETIYQAATELSYYDGTYYEELSDPNKPYYNKELWRRNGSDLGGADPLVLDDTARTGYYYAYVTGLTYSYSKDGICYVNLDNGFLGQGYDVTEAVPVYSIVNSLTGLPGISRVQILINGETDLVYRESIRFDTIFERNLDLVEEE